MHCKNACLIINPRAGKNLEKITDIIAVLSAAGWNTHLSIKEYGGHTMELAQQAAEQGYDLVAAYGGDGTLNQVVNGIMNARGQQSILGLIPGGTANVWAGEVGIPVDPVKAALTLVNSDSRKVDVGHVEITELAFPDPDPIEVFQGGRLHSKQGEENRHIKKVKPASKARHHFLLMAGLGIDAAVMGNVSKPAKYQIGPLAVGLSALKELPKHHSFPIEIRATSGANKGTILWQGEALQVVIGNTRRYADIVQMTPNAYIDDGILDVAVITAGDPLTTVQQIASLLVRRKPDNLTAENFHGAHLSIRVPASINLQLDGSALKLKDYLSKSDFQALQHAGNLDKVMVNYQFDAMPRALRVAIPRKYDDLLFEKLSDQKELQAQSQQQHKAEQVKEQKQNEDKKAQQNGTQSEEAMGELKELVDALLDNGRKVTVIAASPNPAKKKTYIIAGSSSKSSTGELQPVAIVADDNTTLFRQNGEQVSLNIIPELHEGLVILIEGKKSKRGVIHAKRIVI